MSQITEEQLQRSRNLAYLEPALPYITQELDRLRKHVVNRARNARDKGELEPDLALQFWAEYLALDGLERSLTSKMRTPDLTDPANAKKLAAFKRTDG